MTFTWYAILGGFLLSLVLTFILWKIGFLKVSSKRFPTSKGKKGKGTEKVDIMGYALEAEGEEKASFKLDKILEAKIPKWMAKPPFSYAICFLIVCIAVAVVILAVRVAF